MTIAVITTIGSMDDARKLAAEIVDRRLAACANVYAIESFFHWEGAVQNEPEVRIIFKTTAEKYAAIEQAIVELHPYDLPGVYAIELAKVYPPYADWVVENTRSEDVKEA